MLWSLHINLSPLDGLIHVVPGPGARLVIAVVPAGPSTCIYIQAPKTVFFLLVRRMKELMMTKRKMKRIADSPIQKEALSPTGICESTCAFSQ